MKRSTYYYRPNGRPKGKSPSTHTLKNGIMVTNDAVVDEILNLISPDYHDYGYKISADLLKQKGYKINHKKVKRLMKENNLLHPVTKKSDPLNKTFIKYTVPPLEGPFRTIEADIKYIHIHGENRNAFLLTFLCTFFRYAPVWDIQYTMKSDAIAELVEDLVHNPDVRRYINEKQTRIFIRTDNGPQFVAKKLAAELTRQGLAHEFINPGTPQQNAHIESFHSTVSRLVCNKNIFNDLEHARKIFKEFYHAYNETRAMRSLLCYSPKQFLNFWESGIIEIKKDKYNREKFFFREKPYPNQGLGSPHEDFFRLNKINIFENNVLNPMEISPV